jgi:L-rhamnose-H+ transport protein
MDAGVALGLGLAVAAGTLCGTFAAPMKRVRGWNWENTWSMFSLWGCVVLPWVLAWATVPHLGDVILGVSPLTLLWVFLFGAGWGVANAGFGVGLKLLGMAMGMAIVLGLNNAIGTILPLVIFHPEDLVKPEGIAIIVAVAVMIVGIIVCALAGARKEKTLSAAASVAGRTHLGQFGKGLALCVVSGCLGPMFNFAMIFGEPLKTRAADLGASPFGAPNAIWCIGLLGGFCTTMVYCLYLKSANRSWKLYAAPAGGINWLLTFLMGVMWFGGVALYGVAATRLGKQYGPSLGWPILQSMAVIGGNLVGLLSGEWKGAGRASLALMGAGLALLLAGIAIVGWASFGTS